MKGQRTLNPRAPITVQGHVDVPLCDVLTLDTKDRAELTPGQPLIVNGRRFVLTRRHPEEVGEPGAQVYIVLGIDKSTRKQRRVKARKDRLK